MRSLIMAACVFASACASTSAPRVSNPFDNLNFQALQQRLDASNLGFGVTRVPGHDAMVFQVRFGRADASGAEAPDPDIRAAAQAAAPAGCTVGAITPQPDGASYRVDYNC